MLTEKYLKDFRERFVKNFLDILVLRLIQRDTMWGYKIIKKVETLFNIKLRHGALYPLLNALAAKGLLTSKEVVLGRRVRKVYQITLKGTQLIESYYNFLREQLQMMNLSDQET